MAIRLVTKTGGRLSARVHSAFFHLAKGNSLKEKPYGIVPTKDYEDPFGLVFDNTELKVRIKPGQFSCYGRQCIVTEETEVVRMGDVYLTSDKLYMTVYARIDLNDQVFQNVELRYAYNTEAHVDFPKHQMAQNLYRKTNGLYDIPLARFVFHQNPTTSDGYFTDYEKVIETFDDESRAVTKQTERIGSKSETRLFENDTFILKADHANHSKGASLISDTEISRYLDDVWTAKRVKILNQNSSSYEKTTSKTIPIKIDFDHLQYAFIMSEYYHRTSSSVLSVCLKIHVDIFDNTGGITRSGEVFSKLKFSTRIEKGQTYYVWFDRSFIMDSNLRTDKTAVIDLSVSTQRMGVTIASFSLTANGLKWNGEYSSGTFIRNGSGQIIGKLGDLLVVTAEITKGKVVNWFYGNQGKSVYVDFIYKGGVTLV